MRLARYVVLAPLGFLVACGGAPQNGATPSVTGDQANLDFFGADALRGSGQSGGLNGAAPDPSRLKGLSSTQVRSVLGKPVFTRRDAPAEIWQYRGRACTLDVFLYDEGASQTVAHYAVRSAQPVNERDCMGELVSRNQGIPTS